ncbi:hypothetical protein ACHAW6_013406 [Cyclotella cf. meneghiniana]
MSTPPRPPLGKFFYDVSWVNDQLVKRSNFVRVLSVGGPPSPRGPPRRFMSRPSIHSTDPPPQQLPRPPTPLLPGQPVVPTMTPIRDPNLLQFTSKIATQLVRMTNRPMKHTLLGKPPSHNPSAAPPIRPLPQHPFGKLVLNILKGVNLKAGQGVFGRDDPYSALKERNEDFDWKIRTEREREIEIMDEGLVGEDKIVGLARVGILDRIAQGNYEGAIEILDRLNNNAGKQHEFTEKDIVEAFRAFDLDKNTYVAAADIRHVLLNIRESLTDEEVDELISVVEKKQDSQAAFDEFNGLVTGGRNPPVGLGSAVRHSIIGLTDIYIKGLPSSARGSCFTNVMQSPQSGPEIVNARDAKRQALDEFARDNFLKPVSIKRAHRRFQALDKKKSGIMEYTEFCNVLQVEPSVQCEQLFKLYDYERSGLIDAKELLIALANFTAAGKDDKMKFAFMLYDDDSTGSITQTDLVKILRANHLSQTEAEVSRKAETIIAQCDKRNDGTISFDEFVVVSKKFPNILFPYHQSKE